MYGTEIVVFSRRRENVRILLIGVEGAGVEGFRLGRAGGGVRHVVVVDPRYFRADGDGRFGRVEGEIVDNDGPLFHGRGRRDRSAVFI